MRHRCSLVLSVVACLGLACSAPAPREGATQDEARIRYLGHAGWLVRTSEHTLVFDYTGPIDGSGPLSPEDLAGQRVILFVSHAHGDHFKPHVLGLRDQVEDLTVVMGWDEPQAGSVVVPPDGEWIDVAGAEVFTLHHEFDGIPEGFFLVRSGGLVFHHSGDHGTWSDPPSATFRDNIDRLAAAADRIDVAFVSSFGDRVTRTGLNAGDAYTIETLTPRVTFPMHAGGREEQYDSFAEAVASRGLPTKIGLAPAPGAEFLYCDGALH